MQFLCSARKLTSIIGGARLWMTKTTGYAKQQVVNISDKLMNKQRTKQDNSKVIWKQTSLLQVKT